MNISRKAAIGAGLMGAFGMQFATMADITLAGEMSPGRKVYYNQNVILDGAVLNGTTEITVYNGNIIVQGAGVSNHAFTPVEGGIGDSTACNATTDATRGQNGRNGYTLILRTAGGSSGVATGNIEINAPVTLAGFHGANGGRGRNGAHYDDCCQVQPGNGAGGGTGGRGGSLFIYSNNNVTFTSSVSVDGNDGGSGGDAGVPYDYQATSAVPRPGKGGAGGAAGDIKVFARNSIYINNNIVFDARGGDGFHGGDGKQTAFSSVGADGGVGGNGGDVLFHSRYVGPDVYFTGSLLFRSNGGDGGAGGVGGGGNGYSLHDCGGKEPHCGSLTAFRGSSAFGGRGGRSGSGGFMQMVINGDIVLPPPGPFANGLVVYANSGESAPAGPTPLNRGIQQAPPNCHCELPRPGTDGRHGISGGNGGMVVLKGHTLSLNACHFELQGGSGGAAAAGGDVLASDCGTAIAGDGGNGGVGGNGGALSLTAHVAMNCLDGVAFLCGGNGGAGGKGGDYGSCPFGAIGGVGGAKGVDGWLISLGTGVRPDEQSCTHIVDGADGVDSCP